MAFFNVYPGRPQIAIIDIPFTIIDEDSAWSIGKMIDYARETDSIKGVVIKLITLGGGAPESEELYLRMRRLREKKPVVIATGWISASGGMYMSMRSNYICAESSSFVGSIGVILELSGPRPPDELLISTGPAQHTPTGGLGHRRKTFSGNRGGLFPLAAGLGERRRLAVTTRGGRPAVFRVTDLVSPSRGPRTQGRRPA